MRCVALLYSKLTRAPKVVATGFFVTGKGESGETLYCWGKLSQLKRNLSFGRSISFCPKVDRHMAQGWGGVLKNKRGHESRDVRQSAVGGHFSGSGSVAGSHMVLVQ